ncbi:HPr kinase/phosphorylase [Novosphingopyxis iocasae]|uniref:HPr kinase/phosphorylase n=1 Tax=Novosphingopyxis iocasae TaxID=2762729 RepID=UPI001BE41F56|nr:aldolase [Novosphingopyxis iocasae]
MMEGNSSSKVVHGTAVAIGAEGILLLGRPGCGKSDLALRLIDRGALLIADDRVRLARHGETITLSGAAEFAGRMEVRGLDIVTVPHVAAAPFRLAVQCDAVPERLPGPEHRRWLGIPIPSMRLAALEASAPIKAEMALRVAKGAMVDGADAGSKERGYS